MKQVVIGELIKRERLAAGLTQTQLADRLGVKKAVISHWEGGINIPSRPNLQKLSQTLGLDPSLLLAAVPAESPPRPVVHFAVKHRKSGESQATRLATMAGMLTDPRALEILQLFSALENHQRENLLYVCRVAAKMVREGNSGGEPVRSREPLPAG